MTATDLIKSVSHRFPALVLTLLIIACWPAAADEVETEWITPEVGATEGVIGARIRSIEELPESGGQRMVIEIPRESLDYRDTITEIVVTARRPDQSETRLTIEHEWLADYDNDNYGLVLYLGRDGNLPLRIYFKHDRR